MNQNLSMKETGERIASKEDEVQRLTRELEDVKNFTDSIIQSIGSGILIARMNDAVTFINRAGERMLGYSKNELIGKTFQQSGPAGKTGSRSFSS